MSRSSSSCESLDEIRGVFVVEGLHVVPSRAEDLQVEGRLHEEGCFHLFPCLLEVAVDFRGVDDFRCFSVVLGAVTEVKECSIPVVLLQVGPVLFVCV